MPVTYCPECDTQIRLNGSPRKGDQITCNSCGAYLKVVDLSPIELDWADEDEDFIDEEEEFDSDYDF